MLLGLWQDSQNSFIKRLGLSRDVISFSKHQIEILEYVASRSLAPSSLGNVYQSSLLLRFSCIIEEFIMEFFSSPEFMGYFNAVMAFFVTPDNIPAYKQRNWDAALVGPIPFLGLTLGFGAFIFLVEMMLDIRQYDKFQFALSKKKLPKELVGVISEEVFTKSNDCKFLLVTVFMIF
jgi:hypothetical protein